MEQSISVAKGKHHHIHNDPYAGGERSGKCIKPDVLSATANVHVHACAPITIVPHSATVPPSTTTPCFVFMPALSQP